MPSKSKTGKDANNEASKQPKPTKNGDKKDKKNKKSAAPSQAKGKASSTSTAQRVSVLDQATARKRTAGDLSDASDDRAPRPSKQQRLPTRIIVPAPDHPRRNKPDEQPRSVLSRVKDGDDAERSEDAARKTGPSVPADTNEESDSSKRPVRNAISTYQRLEREAQSITEPARKKRDLIPPNLPNNPSAPAQPRQPLARPKRVRVDEPLGLDQALPKTVSVEEAAQFLRNATTSPRKLPAGVLETIGLMRQTQGLPPTEDLTFKSLSMPPRPLNQTQQLPKFDFSTLPVPPSSQDNGASRSKKGRGPSGGKETPSASASPGGDLAVRRAGRGNVEAPTSGRFVNAADRANAEFFDRQLAHAGNGNGADDESAGAAAGDGDDLMDLDYAAAGNDDDPMDLEDIEPQQSPRSRAGKSGHHGRADSSQQEEEEEEEEEEEGEDSESDAPAIRQGRSRQAARRLGKCLLTFSSLSYFVLQSQTPRTTRTTTWPRDWRKDVSPLSQLAARASNPLLSLLCLRLTPSYQEDDEETNPAAKDVVSEHRNTNRAHKLPQPEDLARHRRLHEQEDDVSMDGDQDGSAGEEGEGDDIAQPRRKTRGAPTGSFNNSTTYSKAWQTVLHEGKLGVQRHLLFVHFFPAGDSPGDDDDCDDEGLPRHNFKNKDLETILDTAIVRVETHCPHLHLDSYTLLHHRPNMINVLWREVPRFRGWAKGHALTTAKAAYHLNPGRKDFPETRGKYTAEQKIKKRGELIDAQRNGSAFLRAAKIKGKSGNFMHNAINAVLDSVCFGTAQARNCPVAKRFKKKFEGGYPIRVIAAAAALLRHAFDLIHLEHEYRGKKIPKLDFDRVHYLGYYDAMVIELTNIRDSTLEKRQRQWARMTALWKTWSRDSLILHGLLREERVTVQLTPTEFALDDDDDDADDDGSNVE
ncbi:hypothetical protein DFH06DRAFT_1132689 [Mycena polygramma]|nr:hypothetical protein DFH06DRAFT_1132689 [Mycena polygramma]